MAMKRKAALTSLKEKAIVSVDTNVIYPPKVERIVSSSFEEFLARSRSRADVSFVLPELVVKELVEQRVRLCSCSIAQIDSSLSTIQDVLEKTYKCPVPKSKVETYCNNLVRGWFKRQKIRLMPTPYRDISIKKMERAALKNLPPFQFYSEKSRKGDKGVKDYLIFETFKKMRAQRPSERFVFITRDERLLEALEKEFATDSNVRVYGDFADYLSIIDMKFDGYEGKVVEKVTKQAARMFWDAKKRTGFWTEASVWKRIYGEYKDIIEECSSTDDPTPRPEFKFLEVDQLFNRSHEYIKRDENEVIFHTPILAECNFSSESPLRVARTKCEFICKWSARVGADGRVLGTKYLDADFVGKDLEVEELTARSDKDISVDFERLREHLSRVRKASEGRK